MDPEVSQRGGGEGSSNPLLTQLVTFQMEEAMDKLKILNYEKLFCAKLRIRPLPRHYFALPTNPGEQFHYFTNLAVWLINQCRSSGHIDQPQEYDDPNATIATIIAEAKKLGASTNFPPSKLKSGYGEHVCLLLKELTDRALSSSSFKWKRPQYPEEDTHEEIVQDHSAELSLSKMEDEINEEVESDVEEEEEEGGVYLDLSTMAHQRQADKSGLASPAVVLAGALESVVDPQEWRLELERVLPSLKVHVRSDTRDWRVRYEQMHQHHDSISTALTDTKVLLDKLHQEIAKTLEKISSREKYINSQLDHKITAFRTAQDQLAEVRGKHKEGSSSVNDMARALAQVTAELESVKAEMDEKGTSMTDSGPVVQIKQALTRLRNECKQMEVQIGMVEHTLLVAKFKSKSALKKQMAADTTTREHAIGLF